MATIEIPIKYKECLKERFDYTNRVRVEGRWVIAIACSFKGCFALFLDRIDNFRIKRNAAGMQIDIETISWPVEESSDARAKALLAEIRKLIFDESVIRWADNEDGGVGQRGM